MRSRVYITVRLSVCPVDRQQQRCAAGLPLSAIRAPRTDYRSISAAGARAQQRTLSHVSRGTIETQHRLVKDRVMVTVRA